MSAVTNSSVSSRTVNAIARPEGLPGYLRVDSVHQGDLDKVKDVYHINVVDEVTQFQFVGSVERISERHLLPVLESLLEAFPFRIRGFHSDNGSEYVNYQVAALLEKLRVGEFTKSRPRRSNDNALVESKNGTVVRKQLGYGHIPGRYAQRLDRFNRAVLSPYLNYHRPCYFPSEEIDAKGKLRKRYRRQDILTPYEKLKSVPGAAACLKELPCLLSSTYPGRDVSERRFSCLSLRLARFGRGQPVGAFMRRPAVRGREVRAARGDPRGAECRAGRRACA